MTDLLDYIDPDDITGRRARELGGETNVIEADQMRMRRTIIEAATEYWKQLRRAEQWSLYIKWRIRINSVTERRGITLNINYIDPSELLFDLEGPLNNDERERIRRERCLEG